MNPAAVQDLATQLTPLDSLVLLDRGAELLVQAEILAGLQAATESLYCSRPDRLARGLPLASGVLEADDAVLVSLVEEHQQILSWS